MPHHTPLRSPTVPPVPAPTDSLIDPVDSDRLAFFRIMHEAFLGEELSDIPKVMLELLASHQ
jgi:hypothetical protein